MKPSHPFGPNHGTIAAGSGKLINIAGTVKTTTTVTTPILLPAGNNMLLDNEANAVITGGDGNNRITELGTNARITLGNGNDVVIAKGGGATITVGNGNMEIYVGGANNVITAGNGDDEIRLGAGNKGGAFGHGGTASATATITADTLRLGNGPNKVFIGGSGNTIYAGTGTDSFMGADTGNNIFVLNAAGGSQKVGGFSLTNGDKIDLSAILAGSGVTAATLGSFVTLATVADAHHASWTDTVLTIAGGGSDTVTLLHTGTLTLAGLTNSLLLPH